VQMTMESAQSPVTEQLINKKVDHGERVHVDESSGQPPLNPEEVQEAANALERFELATTTALSRLCSRILTASQ
jgi:hypothetical protein